MVTFLLVPRYRFSAFGTSPLQVLLSQPSMRLATLNAHHGCSDIFPSPKAEPAEALIFVTRTFFKLRTLKAESVPLFLEAGQEPAFLAVPPEVLGWTSASPASYLVLEDLQFLR